MQSFLVVNCILAVAIAAPQGYNYNSPQYATGSSSNLQQQYTIGGGGGGGGVGVGGLQFGGSQYSGGGAIGDSHAFISFNPAPALPSASSVAAAHRAHPHQRRVLPAIVSKHVFIHAAPEEPDEEIVEDNSSEQQRKHYNVVFIKAPHQSVKTIATQTAQALNEEKTAIYVLSKKNDISEVRQALADVPHHPTKPEVFFVKYKTPEEAHHAQQTIQAQYDVLGGSTNVSDEGFAPISSVVGILDGGNGGGHGGFNGGGGGHGGHISGGEATIISGGSSNNIIGAGSNTAGSVAASYLPPNRA